jgi:hypothetical protein
MTDYTANTWTKTNAPSSDVDITKQKLDRLETQVSTISGGAYSYSEAGGDSSRGLYVQLAALSGTGAYRQGALAVSLSRASGQQDSVWDGNPDTAVNISARNSASNATSEGAVRGLQVQGRNSGANINWVLGINVNARNDSGKQAVQVHGQDIRIENYGNVATEIVGLDINLSDENSNSDPHTKHGLRIRNTDASGMGAVDAAILISHTSTNGFTSFASFATATGDGCVASVAEPSGNTTHAIIFDVGGTPIYVPGYAAASF